MRAETSGCTIRTQRRRSKEFDSTIYYERCTERDGGPCAHLHADRLVPPNDGRWHGLRVDFYGGQARRIYLKFHTSPAAARVG